MIDVCVLMTEMLSLFPGECFLWVCKSWKRTVLWLVFGLSAPRDLLKNGVVRPGVDAEPSVFHPHRLLNTVPDMRRKNAAPWLRFQHSGRRNFTHGNRVKEIATGTFLGFKWNYKSQNYNLVTTKRQLWNNFVWSEIYIAQALTVTISDGGRALLV